MKLYLKTTEPNRFIKVETYYDLGNEFAYRPSKRGYYVTVTPVERQERDGVTMESYMAFSGYKMLVHQVTRRGKKAERIAEEKAKDIYPAMVQRVATEQGLTLVEE